MIKLKAVELALIIKPLAAVIALAVAVTIVAVFLLDRKKLGR